MLFLQLPAKGSDAGDTMSLSLARSGQISQVLESGPPVSETKFLTGSFTGVIKGKNVS